MPRVFPSAPRVDRYFAGGSIENARRAVASCIERGDGPALVIGAPGVGKTLLMEIVSDSLVGRARVLRFASTQFCTRRGLLQAALSGLELPYRDMEEGELRLALVEGLRVRGTMASGTALLVDEAHLLAPKLLEELRLLSDLATPEGEPLVRMVLAGAPALDEVLASPELAALNQRIATRCYLAPLSHNETLSYVRSHLAAAGQSPDRFDSEGLNAVHRATDGVPRLINQLCERVLVNERGRADARHVQAAWADLHQLPAPWYSPEVAEAAVAPPAPQLASIEFSFIENEDAAWADLMDAAPAPAASSPSLASPIVTPAPAYVADQALGKIAREAVSQTVDPFADAFEEEEVVIDRFASLEAAFHPATPHVVNTLDPAMGDSLARLEPAACKPASPAAASGRPFIDTLGEFAPPSLVLRTDTTAKSYGDASLGAAGFRADAPAMTDTDGESDEEEDDYVYSLAEGDEESDVLVIEREFEPLPQAATGARRSDYRRLFANLRRGS